MFRVHSSTVLAVLRRSNVSCRRFVHRSEGTTEFPSASDILYRNPEAIANRINLFHLLRLQLQARIDRKSLENITQSHKENQYSDENCIRVTTCYKTGLAGIEKQFDPSQAAVKLRVTLSSLGLSSVQLRQLKMLLEAGGLGSICKKYFELIVGDFPFQSQNRQRAFDVLRNLINEVKSLQTVGQGETETLKHPSKNRSRSKSGTKLGFPMHWLQNVRPKETVFNPTLGKLAREKTNANVQQ